MRVKVKIPGRFTDETEVVHEIDMSDGSRVIDMVRSLDIQPDQVLVFYDDKPVPIDGKLEDGDEIRLVYIASRG